MSSTLSVAHTRNDQVSIAPSLSIGPAVLHSESDSLALGDEGNDALLQSIADWLYASVQAILARFVSSD